MEYEKTKTLTALEQTEVWQMARESLCDGCPQARGCFNPCQALRNEVKSTTISLLASKKQ